MGHGSGHREGPARPFQMPAAPHRSGKGLLRECVDLGLGPEPRT